MLTTVALLLHVLAELCAASVLLINPEIFVDGATFVHQESLRGVGNGALSIGLVGAALLCTREDGSALRRLAYGVVAQYHTGVVYLQIRHPLTDTPVWLAPAFHGFLLLCFLRRVCLPGNNSGNGGHSDDDDNDGGGFGGGGGLHED